MCEASINIKNPLFGKRIGEFKRIFVPCGKCIQCLKKRSNEWSFRLQQEERNSSSAYFVTLTYENAPRSFNGLLTGDKSDLQKFFKRLRKREINNTNIKYYAVLEYGEQLQRPHYHAIIFNVQDKNNILRAWTVTPTGGHLPVIIGDVHIGDVEPASINYVTHYLGKKIGIPVTDYDDRLKEFSLMSKNMGMKYIHDASKFHNETETPYTYFNQKKIILPRYYKNKIFNDEIKRKISLENQKRFTQIENRKIKDYSAFLSREKNRFENAKLNVKSKQSFTNNSKSL